MRPSKILLKFTSKPKKIFQHKQKLKPKESTLKLILIKKTIRNSKLNLTENLFIEIYVYLFHIVFFCLLFPFFFIVFLLNKTLIQIKNTNNVVCLKISIFNLNILLFWLGKGN